MKKDVFENQNKGITLVALTVTIIVLIILASISLNLLLGNDGILKKTKDGRNNYLISANEEAASLAKLYQDTEMQINGESPNNGDGINWEQIMQTATKHPDQHDTNDIGLDVNGNPINLDLWNYEINGKVVQLHDPDGSQHDGYCYIPYGEDYSNTNQDIEYHNLILPQYIKKYGEEEFFPVTSLSAWSFGGCTDLYSIVLPDTLEYIGVNSFFCCKNLSSVKLPQKLKTIYSGAFYECENLENIDLPESLEKIEYNTFFGCSNLISVKLPKNLKELDNGVFEYCDKLESFYIDSPYISGKLNVFDDINMRYNRSSVVFIYIKENIYDDSINQFTARSGNTYIFRSIKDGYAMYVREGIEIDEPGDEPVNEIGSELGSETD